MPAINNPLYRTFLDKGIIKPITQIDLNKALNNINNRHKQAGRSLLITMFYTGARPAEVLELKAENLTKERSYLLVEMSAVKRGLPRTIYLRLSNPHIKELYNYAKVVHPKVYLFLEYRSNYTRLVNGKYQSYVANKLDYYFKQWFQDFDKESISAYYLRHNCFSELSRKGASMQDLRMLKGSRTLDSITPYLHLSSATAKKLSKKLS